MSSRVPVIAGNWKMYKTSAEGAAFVAALAARLDEAPPIEVVVAPTFAGLFEAVGSASGTPVTVAAQDVYWETEGAFTGEVSPLTLAALGVTWVIVGHSERRQFFFETDDTVAKKVRACLDAGLKPIMCVGETEQERVDGFTESVLERQAAAGLALVQAEELATMAVAYEPIWAIGTGRTATPEIAQEACAYVRERAAAACGGAAASRVRILYGGSVKPGNTAELMSQPDIDGGLVGGASLEVDSFADIIRHTIAQG